jgi:hypothetical protein
MRISLLLALGLLASVAAMAADDAGFKKLFDGQTLTGWSGNPKLWSVKDGVIQGQTTKENPTQGNTFLVYTIHEFADFELRFSYKIDGGNSGVQYRSKVVNPENWVVGGYQGDFEAGKKYSGILYDEAGVAGGRGIMAERGESVIWDEDCKKKVVGSVGKSDEIQAKIKADGWNEYVIIAHGNQLMHQINGAKTVEVTDNCEAKRLTKGVLALQLHAGPPMVVQFKNIRIKELK